jgi:glucose-1-phosphate thymidylyltransferase
METKIQKAIILVGGAGLRMRPLTEDMPKCMIQLHGKPLIHWTLSWLKRHNFQQVVLGVSYHKEVIMEYVKKNPIGIDVVFSKHTQEGETGEGFRLAIERYIDDENFLAMNGDEFTNMNIKKFSAFHLKHKPVATIAVSRMQAPFGILEIEGNDIVGFKEKPILYDKLVNMGIYIFNHAILDYLPTKGAVEKTAFPALAEKRLLKAYRLGENERWLTINSIKDLSVAEQEFTLIRGL